MPFQRFSIPTVRISDAFRFEPDLPGSHWEQVLETISRDFFRGSSYHLQLQTTEGDKYLRLYPREWHYFVSERRDRLWFMSMEIHSGRGEFMKLELDFHPLISGPNANIEVCSSRAEELIKRVVDSIGVDESVPPKGWHEIFSFPAEIIDINFLEQAIRQLSREHLQRTPPIAFLSTTSGLSYTGLSLFQLRNLLPKHLEEISVLSIGVTRPMSGQTMSLMFEFSPGYTAPFVSLNLLWGNETLHRSIRDRIERLFGLQSRGQHADWTGSGKRCSVSLDWRNPNSSALWTLIDQTLRQQGLTSQPLRSLYAHQAWDDTMSAVHDASFFLIDLSEQSPESLYLAGFARSSGKPVILIARDLASVPAGFSDLPVLVYEHSLLGRELLADSLSGLLTDLDLE